MLQQGLRELHEHAPVPMIYPSSTQFKVLRLRKMHWRMNCLMNPTLYAQLPVQGPQGLHDIGPKPWSTVVHRTTDVRSSVNGFTVCGGHAVADKQRDLDYE
jgi:hypothetical protein